jgi:hypothetical protein
VIGTNVQAYDADLTSWSAKTAPTGDVVGTSDSQILTNKTISGSTNTLSNIANSSLTNSAITINGTAVSLGGTRTLSASDVGAEPADATILKSASIGSTVQGYDADLGAIAALAGTSGLLKKTAANTWTLDTTAYGTGTVTAVSVDSANGFTGTSSGGATPALTLATSISGLLKGNGTALSAATANTDYVEPGAAGYLAVYDYATTATTGGTTTLTAASTVQQYFTGTSAQNVQLPVTSTLALGWSFYITNTSSNILTVISSGSNTVCTVNPGVSALLTCILTTGTTAASWDVGYFQFDIDIKTIPQNAQAGNYGIVASDSGKHVYHASGAALATYTIPANSAVPFAIGTTLTFVNMSTNAVTISITTDTLHLAGTGTTGNRTLAQFGTATAIKLTATTWLIAGTNLT